MFQRTIPLIIVFVFGLLTTIQYWIPHPISQRFYRITLDWMNGIMGMAIILATGSLLRHHFLKIKRKENIFNSSITILGFLFMSILGLFFGIGEGSLFQKIFLYIQVPLQATMFSLLAFFMASASYRAFRIRNFEALLLIFSAFILMIGFIPVGEIIYDKFPEIAQWLLDVPNMAAKRGIMIGVGLGMISTSIKIILGIERSWLGR